MALVKLLQHLLTLGVGERIAEGEEGCGSSCLQNPVREGEDKLVFYNLKDDKISRTGHTDQVTVRLQDSRVVLGLTSHVGLSRTLSQRALPGKVRTRGAMP